MLADKCQITAVCTDAFWNLPCFNLARSRHILNTCDAIVPQVHATRRGRTIFRLLVAVSQYTSVRLSVRLSVRPFVCPSVRLSVCPSVRLSVRQSVWLPVRPSVFLSVNQGLYKKPTCITTSRICVFQSFCSLPYFCQDFCLHVFLLFL